MPDAGLREFKKGWGAREELLTYSAIAEAVPHASRRRLPRALGRLISRSPVWVGELSANVFTDTRHDYPDARDPAQQVHDAGAGWCALDPGLPMI